MNLQIEKIVDLNKKVNSNDLIYKYKGNDADAKFCKFDNALGIIDKIKNSEISLADVKNKKRKQQKNIKRAKKTFVQYLNALQSKKRGY